MIDPFTESVAAAIRFEFYAEIFSGCDDDD